MVYPHSEGEQGWAVCRVLWSCFWPWGKAKGEADRENEVKLCCTMLSLYCLRLELFVSGCFGRSVHCIKP